MTQFDLYRTRGGDLVVDCQSDVLAGLNSRLAIPLFLEPDGTPAVSERLNPTVAIDGRRMVLKTHFAAAMAVRDLGERVGSLDGERYTIQAALDFLFSGF